MIIGLYFQRACLRKKEAKVILKKEVWSVTAVAIAGVLLMNLLAVGAVAWGWRPAVGGLFPFLLAGIAVNYLVPTSALLGLPPLARLAASVALFYGPLFFSGWLGVHLVSC